MRWRAAMLLALLGIVAIPAVSDAIEPNGAPTEPVSVKPRTGSPATHFVISFKVAQGSGRIGSAHEVWRVTATNQTKGNCLSSAMAVAPPAQAGATVHVKLAPRARGWCSGTFHGVVSQAVLVPCAEGKACPALLPLPRMVGKFTFRVRRG